MKDQFLNASPALKESSRRGINRPPLLVLRPTMATLLQLVGGSRRLNTTTAATGRSTPSSRPGRKPFYKVGDWVQRNGSAAWVTDAYPTPLGKWHNYNLKYVVDKRRESFGIPIGGMKPTTLEPAGRKRRGREGPVRSSLLSSISVRPPLAPRPPKV
jgi:hypothetical protein